MSDFILIKLKDDVYLAVNSMNSYIDPKEIMFGMYGVRSKGKTIIIPQSIWSSLLMAEMEKGLTNKKIGKVDRIIFTSNSTSATSTIYSKKPGYVFRNIAKTILVREIYRWVREANITNEQIAWFTRIINYMLHDEKFLLGQLPYRVKLNSLRQQLPAAIESVQKREEQLRHMEEVQTASTSVENIKRMKWIDKIGAHPEGLSILTKPMACTHLPNIAEFIDARYIAKSDILYKIMKYQFLGKYLIVLPDYYVVRNNFEIKGDHNDRYPVSRVRQIIQSHTYFHGMACHIGDGQACVGELGSAIADANKNGLDMLLMAFEAYLRSINIPDAAGQRFYCLPMGDASGKIEVWPYMDTMLKKHHIRFYEKRSLEAYEQAIKRDPVGCFSDRPSFCACNNTPIARDANLESCLELVRQREPKIYEQIIQRQEKGVVA